MAATPLSQTTHHTTCPEQDTPIPSEAEEPIPDTLRSFTPEDGLHLDPRRKTNLGAARVKAASEAELACFFGAELPSPEPATAISEWLAQLKTFHRGALTLHYTPRLWPRLLRSKFKEWTSLVVRLDCAMHPSDGTKTVEVLEAEAVARLETSIRLGDDNAELRRLQDHARQHLKAALVAYARVRGAGPCVVRTDSKEGA